jgi:AcrR family transcriptional regulator
MASPTEPSRNPTYYAGDLQRALLDATADAIEELGPAAVSLREVARRVGVSHAAPAHHFGDKAGLFTALATEGFELLGAAVRRATAQDPGGTDRRTLVAAGVAYVGFAASHRAHFEVMWRADLLRTEHPAYLAAAAAAFDALVDVVSAHQRDGWAPGRSLEDLTLSAWATAHGVATLHNAGALAVVGSRSPEEVATAVLTMHTAALDRPATGSPPPTAS